MFVSSTAPDGVVGSDTRLTFQQRGDRVIARYAGGAVARGILVGRVIGERLVFRYAQRERDGVIHGGRSVCDVIHLPDGRLRVMERFEWSTRAGRGINTFDELA
jgi:hypothetical protein